MHIAGYGVDLLLAANITFFKHFFIQGELKGGFINMPNVLTTRYKDDHAAHHFFFLQRNVNFGYMFKL
ncbi:hypothetical protein CLV98_10380 [Dyadobacter jejuensis]|uniref:Uncharacterized protein n=1 Tax=Dyadobacter jejuensis TaxID=1082580 RepID=A0A316ANK8_9BACT|nr:hypothetical protein [Dyadobacter jejuensis]PWJ58714.1 hypothetical protein CLV98_10380 [Dyadobacter jejuensis]